MALIFEERSIISGVVSSGEAICWTWPRLGQALGAYLAAEGGISRYIQS
jgi:hypothetical protein